MKSIGKYNRLNEQDRRGLPRLSLNTSFRLWLTGQSGRTHRDAVSGVLVEASAKGLTVLIPASGVEGFQAIQGSMEVEFERPDGPRVRAQVVNIINHWRNDWTRLGLAVRSAGRRDLEDIAKILIRSLADVSPLKLRDAGFPMAGSLQEVVTAHIVRSERDRDQVLELRLKAYQNSKKFLAVKSAREMEDEYDSRAKLLALKTASGRMVATVRILDVPAASQFFEHAERWEADIPLELQNQAFLELSRACTDPEFRGSNLFALLLAEIAELAVESERRYLLMNCSSYLVRAYGKLGFRDLGARRENSTVPGLKQHLMLLDLQRVTQKGYLVHPLVWRTFYYPAIRNLAGSGRFRFVSRPGAWYFGLHRFCDGLIRKMQSLRRPRLAYRFWV